VKKLGSYESCERVREREREYKPYSFHRVVTTTCRSGRMFDDADTERNIDKETLMKLVAQQMVSTLLAGDDEGDEDAIVSVLQRKMKDRERARRLTSRKTRTRSSARPTKGDSPPRMPPTPTECLLSSRGIVLGEYDDELNDLAAFSKGRSPLSGTTRFRESNDEMTKGTGTSSAASNSNPGSRTDSQDDSKNDSINTGEMSVEELRQYVMDNIPQEEAWAMIFKPPSSSGTPPVPKFPTSIPTKEPRKNRGAIPLNQIQIRDKEEEEDDDDDSTIFSDVTGLTDAFPDGRFVEYRMDSPVRASATRAMFDEDIAEHHIDSSFRANHAITRVDEDFSEQSPSVPSIRSNERSLEASSIVSSRSGKASALDELRQFQARQAAGVNKVCFGHVQVRFYERTISDNPSVQSGVAIGIGWKYKRGNRSTVDQWELARGPIRSSAELVLSRHVRERMLREAGITQKEIAEMVRAGLKAKNQRKQTINNLHAQGLEETVERARRRFAKLLTLVRSSS